MAKWIAITLFTLLCFMVVLLGLGYLLSENEKSTTILKHQLEQDAQLAQKKSSQDNNIGDYPITITAADGSTISPQIISTKSNSKQSSKAVVASDASIMQSFENTVINNLTCVTAAQCQVVSVKFKNINCQLASNMIGASQLKKIATSTINIDTCPMVTPQSQLACQQNICTLVSLGD